MKSNFEFLKSYDCILFDIISDAENLYRDEYFEQCISQTRRYAENLCKKVLGERRTSEKTFDDMLATLKDNATHSKQEQEFIEDLYFLKREGNNSVHAAVVKKDGIIALECLQRAFELAINYSVYNLKGKSSLLKLQFDTELLITGTPKKTLKERYEIEKNKVNKEKISSKGKTKTKKTTSIIAKPRKHFIFKTLLKISFLISSVLVLIIYILTLV